ncbi:hypothetical protein JCM8547_004357 [Rhodosporidiobolus lusitaniae]
MQLSSASEISKSDNVKLGGTNAIPALGPIVSKPTIVFGADVSHAAPGSTAPSIVGVVASMDKQITRYGSRIAVQPSRQEHIAGLEGLVRSLLLQFKKSVKVKPERLIFYRDGVSEGQFPIVLAHEFSAIRAACRAIDPNFKPAITYIVCGKRQHLSMFPVARAASDGKTGNVRAGTTIDTEVVSPFIFDWYTQSHASLFGTSRSCHYTVLVDETRFSADAIQQFSNAICYGYQRCTRSVSYATPAYYADLVCARGALLLSSDDDASSTAGSDPQAAAQLEARYRDRFRALHVNQMQRLFFMYV